MSSAESMGRHQRFAAAVRCLPVDRPPVTAWMHLGSEHLPPAYVAQLHEAYWRAYDWDALKVMADYRVEIPLSIESFDTPQSLGCLQTAVQTAHCFARQYECVAHLMERVGQEVPVLDSGYDPYTLVLRHIGRDQVRGLGLNTEALQAVLDALTQQICRHIERLKALGVAGYFHATFGAIHPDQPHGVDQETFERCIKPFDLRILQAAQGMVRVLHAHGSGLQLERLADYQLEVLHIADRTPSNPTLAQLRASAGAGKCLMGGVDERTFTSFSVGGLRAQMGDAVAQVGTQGLILAPGCAVSPSSSGRLLKALRAGVGGASA